MSCLLLYQECDVKIAWDPGTVTAGKDNSHLNGICDTILSFCHRENRTGKNWRLSTKLWLSCVCILHTSHSKVVTSHLTISRAEPKLLVSKMKICPTQHIIIIFYMCLPLSGNHKREMILLTLCVNIVCAETNIDILRHAQCDSDSHCAK